MKIKSLLVAVGITLLLSGCGNMPLAPDELRQMAIKKQMFVKTESFTVRRPYKKVVATIRSRSNRCLRVSVKTTVKQGGTTTNVHYTHYKPTFVTRRKLSELHLQTKVGNTIVVAKNRDKIGKDGWYVLVTDIRPAGAGRTRLDIHRAPKMGIIVKAIHNWAKGSNLGCPDLTNIS